MKKDARAVDLLPTAFFISLILLSLQIGFPLRTIGYSEQYLNQDHQGCYSCPGEGGCLPALHLLIYP